MRILNRLKADRWPVLVAVLLLYWAFGFYPYQLPPYHNGAVRAADHGLRFDAPGVAYTREPPAWLPTAIGSPSLRVMLEVRAGRVAGTESPRSEWPWITDMALDKRRQL